MSISIPNDTAIRDILKRKPQPKLLRKLADYLENEVKDSKFDMGSFCGTARCAFGHAPSIPAIGKLVKIKRLSFRDSLGDRVYYTDLRTDPEIETKIAKARYAAHYESFGSRAARDLVDSFDRAQYVFGITEFEAGDVFGDDGSGHSRASVAEKLRNLAAKYE